MEVSLRCLVCKVKVRRDLVGPFLETFQEALDLGVMESKWELYWAVMEENNVLCHLHESNPTITSEDTYLEM